MRTTSRIFLLKSASGPVQQQDGGTAASHPAMSLNLPREVLPAEGQEEEEGEEAAAEPKLEQQQPHLERDGMMLTFLTSLHLSLLSGRQTHLDPS